MPGGIAPVNAVAFGLTLAWALVGWSTRTHGSGPAAKPSPFHLLAAIDALVAAVALTAGRKAELVACAEQRPRCRDAGRHRRDRDLVPLPPRPARRPAARLRPACPGGRGLPGGGRRRTRVRPRPSALLAGRRRGQLVHRGSPGDRAAASPLHRIHRVPPRADGVVRDRRDPRRHGGADGDRPPPAGGLAGSAGRGRRLARPCWSRSASWPARTGRWGRTPSRGLVQVLAIFGFVVVVSAIYLVVVLGLGHAPKTTGDKEVLALSMVASGVAAVDLRAGAGAVPRVRHQVRLRIAGGP